jgi:hypothetical protein
MAGLVSQVVAREPTPQTRDLVPHCNIAGGGSSV